MGSDVQARPMMMVDVDSTLYDADKLFYRLAQEAGIVDYPKKSYQWFRAHELNVSQQTLTNLFRRAHSREVVEEIKPYKGSVEVLNQFADTYPDVIIRYVSSRNARAEGPLREWIKAQGYPLDHDTYVTATMNKKEWIFDYVPSIVIDDRVQTMIISRFGGRDDDQVWHDVNAWVLSLKHPHNINLTNEVDGIFMCDDWYEIGYKLATVAKLLGVKKDVQSPANV